MNHSANLAVRNKSAKFAEYFIKLIILIFKQLSHRLNYSYRTLIIRLIKIN